MTTGPTERVILIKGDATKWYNQAIFIVNQNTPATKMPVDFVEEAEKIIYGYMARKNATPQPYHGVLPKPSYPKSVGVRTKKKKTSTFDFVLNTVMVLACIAIAAIFAYGLMS